MALEQALFPALIMDANVDSLGMTSRSGDQTLAPSSATENGDQDASLRSGAPTALASQASLWREEPTRIVGHAIERLHRDDGVGITICHTHRREVIGWGRRPCP